MCHCLLAWSVSIEKSVANVIGSPLYVTSCFSLAPFKVLSLYWNFAILIMTCLGIGLFGFLLFGTLCVSWIYMSIAFTKLGKLPVHQMWSSDVQALCFTVVWRVANLSCG